MSTYLSITSPNKIPQRTFKPRRAVEGTKQFQLKKYAEATLGSGNLAEAVKLPQGEDSDEWIAIHCVDFFNHLNMLYGCVNDFCTLKNCPIMSAGPRYEYQWAQPSYGAGAQSGAPKRLTRLSAPEYVDNLLNWIQSIIDNEAYFPSKLGVAFPRNFSSIAKDLFRRLFRVYAHIYNSHFEVMVALGIEAHLNTNYRHFLLFIHEFKLVDTKELAPLADFNQSILK
ncbi:hypothetical protein E3P99_00221 [Wallemia hederae]|uniref:Mob1/phocein n=1 Tax=Wallemia hederae TaxID=1540922 RepID=A0A4T0FZT0_9BASI|nr:hypothetical protein E3P99_00221 [Wallemia hederae]